MVQIQQSLVGISPRDLEKLAGLSSEFWRGVQIEIAEMRPATSEAIRSQDSASVVPRARALRSRQQFWVKEPALDEATTPDPGGVDKSATTQCALHIQAGDGVELVLRGIDPNSLDRKTSARLQEIVEKVARELNQLPLTLPPLLRREEKGG